MEHLDPHAFQCGVIDSLNELVRDGFKALAFSRPADTAQERDALLPFARSACLEYGTQLYIEDQPLICDLFPRSKFFGKFLLLFYRENHILDQYLRLKGHKQELLEERAYFGGNRSRLALEFGRLLSYQDENARRLIAENGEKEHF